MAGQPVDYIKGHNTRRQTSVGMKWCPGCKTEKPADREHFAPSASAGGLDGYCKGCRGDRAKEWYRQPGNAERAKATVREWEKANPEKAKENHRRKREQKPDLYRTIRAASSRRRRDRKRGATPETHLYAEIVRRDPCSYCSSSGGTADHIVALAKGGEDHEDNLTGACINCNLVKHTKPLLLFLLDRAGVTTP